jgi:predicted lipid-binding transport protein (Tim44 family)
VHQGFVAGYAASIQTVFLIAVPIAALAFLATWLIPQVELKRWPTAGAPGAPGAPGAAGSPGQPTEAPAAGATAPAAATVPVGAAASNAAAVRQVTSPVSE